jgi:hypothetical protein
MRDMLGSFLFRGDDVEEKSFREEKETVWRFVNYFTTHKCIGYG